MALRPAKCDEKSVVISRLSGKHFDPLFLLNNGRNKIHETAEFTVTFWDSCSLLNAYSVPFSS